MKLASFRDGSTDTWGWLQAGGVRLAPPALRSRYPGLREILAAGALAASGFEDRRYSPEP